MSTEKKIEQHPIDILIKALSAVPKDTPVTYGTLVTVLETLRDIKS